MSEGEGGREEQRAKDSENEKRTHQWGNSIIYDLRRGKAEGG